MNAPARHMFSYDNGEDSVCLNTTAESLPEILDRFGDYLRGCGYFFDGEVTICEHEHGHKPCQCQAPADLNPAEDDKEDV